MINLLFPLFSTDNMQFEPEYSHLRVFNDAEKSELVKCLSVTSKHHHGLTTATEQLSYQYAFLNKNTFAQLLNIKTKAEGRLAVVIFEEKYSNYKQNSRRNHCKQNNTI